MALVPYVEDMDILFPGVQEFTRFIFNIDPLRWAQNMYSFAGRYLWNTVLMESRRQIAHHTTELATRTASGIQHSLANFFENARWAVSNLGSNIYTGLQGYYRELPGLNPPQARALARRLGVEQPDRYQLEAGGGGRPSDKPKTQPVSAEYVEKYPPPGGAGQRVAPDWMLPLLLGLYGDLNPTWKAAIEVKEQDEPPKKRTKATPRPSAKTTNKRRDRSARSANRTR
ncbi:VP3 [Potamochoerus porcus polyomavirus 1]|nr:VP3 [Potamochoerus porcus polyomavirus 1]AWD33729.1 VP3 [Potamochoerus porcus polyomavirus 1]